MPKKTCSFCGRSDSEVKLLISGLSGFICEDCAAQAYEIVQSAGFGDGQTEKKKTNNGVYSVCVVIGGNCMRGRRK